MCCGRARVGLTRSHYIILVNDTPARYAKHRAVSSVTADTCAAAAAAGSAGVYKLWPGFGGSQLTMRCPCQTYASARSEWSGCIGFGYNCFLLVNKRLVQEPLARKIHMRVMKYHGLQSWGIIRRDTVHLSGQFPPLSHSLLEQGCLPVTDSLSDSLSVTSRALAASFKREQLHMHV